MDAIKFLTQDHNALKKLLAELSDTTNRAAKTRTNLRAQIKVQAESHNKIEEEIFYPAFKAAGDGKDDDQMYFEALEEHRAAGTFVLPDLMNTPVDSDQFAARAKVLKELIEHHIKEEESEMFPRTKQLMGKEELEALGEQLQARKAKLVKELA